jgi:predicted nucleic acid-binding protein
MNAVDTNVLFYAHDPREPAKRSRAMSLIESLDDGALLWQVACEFVAASRKLEPHGFSRDRAWEELRVMPRVWATVLPTWPAIDRAEKLLTRYSLSYWDAMIVGACLEGGISRLYTEDYAAYPKIDGLEIINPFGTP